MPPIQPTRQPVRKPLVRRVHFLNGVLGVFCIASSAVAQVASHLPALAQATTPAAEATDFMSLLGNIAQVSPSGFIAWFAWFTVTRTIPEIVQQSREDLAAQREDFRNELAEMRQFHQKQLEALANVKPGRTQD